MWGTSLLEKVCLNLRQLQFSQSRSEKHMIRPITNYFNAGSSDIRKLNNSKRVVQSYTHISSEMIETYASDSLQALVSQVLWMYHSVTG